MSRISCRLPPSYKNSDFADIIKKLSEETKIRVEDGLVKMDLKHKNTVIERFGKRFDVWLVAACGHVMITITELNEK